MSMDSICMLLRHGICCMDMVYALGRWDMLYGHGRCLVVGEEYMRCIYSTCTVCTVHVLYVQYMFCRWNVFSKKILRKNDFEKMTLFFENLRFLIKKYVFCSKTLLLSS